MANETFIPQVWAKAIAEKLEPRFIWVEGCNRDFEGDIKQRGDAVRIKTVGEVTAHRISAKNHSQQLAAPDSLNGGELIVNCDQLTYAQVKCDNIEELQNDPKVWAKAQNKIASAIAGDLDNFVAGLSAGVKNVITVEQDSTSGNKRVLNADKLINYILKAKEALYVNNVSKEAALELIVPEEVHTLATKAKILVSTDNDGYLTNGKVGSLLGLTVKSSNNYYTDASGLKAICLRVKDEAVAFASQITKVIKYRDDANEIDSDFVRAYSIFGGKVLFQDQIVVIKYEDIVL